MKLPLSRKIIFVAGCVTIISVFLPWYSDIDRFNIGETYLGITGPMYLAGLLIFLSAVASVGIIVLKAMQKPVPKLPVKEEHFYVLTGALSLLMLVLTLSVYFHPKFGINLTDKSSGIGIILAFIGAGVTIFGGALALRQKEVNFDQEGHIEPLIDVESMQRERHDLDMKKDVTIEEAMARHNQGTKAWGQVQESINNFTTETDNTRDIK